MARIYTRTGDGGETSLLGGRRASKADVRVDLYGQIDELNCCLGLVGALTARAPLPELLDLVARWQSQLFELGALLADPERSARQDPVDEQLLTARTAELEAVIDRLEADLPPLRNFILPGGGEAAAALHLARAVCRRAERRAVAARAAAPFPGAVISYLNRLADLLFVAARWAGHARGETETLWRAAAPGAARETRHE